MEPRDSEMCPCRREWGVGRGFRCLARLLVKRLSTRLFPRAPMTTTQTSAHSFSLLLASYIAGNVDSEELDALCDLVEEADATPAERLAFARYFLDSKGEETAAMPKLAECTEILQAARA